MRVENKHQKKAFEERVRSLKEHHAKLERDLEVQAPKPISLTQHPEGKAPKRLANGVAVMAGDYYGEIDGNIIVVPASDIGKDGAWQEV